MENGTRAFNDILFVCFGYCLGENTGDPNCFMLILSIILGIILSIILSIIILTILLLLILLIIILSRGCIADWRH